MGQNSSRVTKPYLNKCRVSKIIKFIGINKRESNFPLKIGDIEFSIPRHLKYLLTSDHILFFLFSSLANTCAQSPHSKTTINLSTTVSFVDLVIFTSLLLGSQFSSPRWRKMKSECSSSLTNFTICVSVLYFVT